MRGWADLPGKTITVDEELKRKLEAEAWKSGIPLEMRVVKAVREAPGAIVRQNVRFEAGGVVREIDALAHVSLTDDDHRGHEHDRFIVDLIVECKTSRKRPWVFFEEPWDPLSGLGLVDRVAHRTDLRFKQDWTFLHGCHNSPLGNHHYNSPIPCARSYFEAFGSDAGQDIYKALQSVERGKAHLSSLLIAADRQKPSSGTPPWRSRLVHGVIVFEGVLALANHDSNDVTVRPVSHLLLRSDNLPAVMGSMGQSYQKEVLIDVIHVDALQSYIDVLYQDLNALAQHVAAIRAGSMLDDEYR